MNYESVMWVLTVVVAAVLVLIALTNVFCPGGEETDQQREISGPGGCVCDC